MREASEELSPHKASLERWLASAGLDEGWKVEKLKWGDAPPGTEERRALRLELRFLGEDTNQDAQEQEFRKRLEAYRAAFGESAPERCV